MKLLNIILLVLLLCNFYSCNKIPIDQGVDCSTVDIVNFEWSTDCLVANGGCDITQAKYWNFTGDDKNPSDFSLTIDVSDQEEQILFFINSTFTPCKFHITGNNQSSLVLGNDVDIKEGSTFIYSTIKIGEDYQYTFGMIILVQSDILLSTGAKLVSNQLAPSQSSNLLSVDALPPTFSLDDTSSLKLQDNALVNTTYLHSDGSISISGQAKIQSTQIVISNYFYISTNASIIANDVTLLNVSQDGSTLVILGNFGVSNSLYLYSSDISLNNLDISALSIDEQSTLSIESGSITINSLSLYGGFNIIDSTFIFTSTKLITLNQVSAINLQGITNATFGNIVFNNNLKTTPNPANVLNTTITIVNNVYFQTSLTLKSIINVQPQANLYIIHDLELEDCINNQGTVQLHGMLVCYQKEFNNIGGNSDISLMDKAVIYTYEFNNNGTISIVNSATLNGNLISQGTVSIYEDQSFKVTGYCDLFSDSATLIQGITYNTSFAAFDVTNIIKLSGELFFNITDPPIKSGYFVYHLIRSQIYLEGQFSNIVADPSLTSYTLPIDYDHNSNGEVSELSINFQGPKETSSEIEKSEEEEKEKSRRIDIALGILLPLVGILFAILVVYVFLKRRNKNFALYQKINDNDL